MLKKVLVAAAAAVVMGGGTFAQTSMTSKSTSGLFGNDIDDFMSVTGWSGVKPENAFFMAGHSYNGYNLGFAKQFKPFYMGVKLDGKFKKATITSGDNSSYNDVSANVYSVSTLFGFSNIGVKATVAVGNGGINDVKNGDTQTKTENFILLTGVEFGMNTTLKNKAFKPVASIALTSNVDKSYTKAGSTETKTDNSKYNLALGADAEWDIYAKGAVTNTTALAFKTNFNILPNETFTNTKTYGAYDWGFVLIPAWTTKYEVEKFKFGVNVTMPINFNFIGTPDYLEVNGSKTYPESNPTNPSESIRDRTFTNTIAMAPNCNVGASIQIAKPVAFNVGTTIDVPYLQWKFVTTKNRDSSGNETSTAKANTFTFNENNAGNTVKFTSGFAFNCGKNVMVDTSYGILSQFNGFEWDKGTNFWDTVNKLIFAELKAQVTVKL